MCKAEESQGQPQQAGKAQGGVGWLRIPRPWQRPGLSSPSFLPTTVASPSSTEEARPAPVSAPVPPSRASRGPGSELAAVAGGQVGPQAPRPPGTPPETR